MRRRLVYLAAAQRDLVSILEYITRESGSVAIGAAFTDRLQAQCAKLTALPGTLGRARPELRPDLRSSAFGNYVIFFRYRDDLDAYKARFGREAEIIDDLGSCRSWAPIGPRRLDEEQAQAIKAKRTGEAK